MEKVLQVSKKSKKARSELKALKNLITFQGNSGLI